MTFPNVEKKARLTAEEIEQIESIQVEKNGRFCHVRIVRKDGTSETMGCYFQDQDLPEGTYLDPDKCVIVSKRAGNKLPEYLKMIKLMHYEGLDFVPDWVTVSSKELTQVYRASAISDITIVATEYGLSASIAFTSGKSYRIPINRDSRILEINEKVEPKDCKIVKMRKFHTRVFESLLVV